MLSSSPRGWTCPKHAPDHAHAQATTSWLSTSSAASLGSLGSLDGTDPNSLLCETFKKLLDIAPGGGTEADPHRGAQLWDGVKLHKANGRWHHNFVEQDLQVEVMFALTDFTEENGATHVVLGSNRETPRDGPLGYERPTVQATMRRGSCLVWTGWSIHGAGVNRSSAYRTGLNIDYALAFLTQEE